MQGNLFFTVCPLMPLLFLASQPVLTPGKAPLHDGSGAGVQAERCSRGLAGAGALGCALGRAGVCGSCGALGCAQLHGALGCACPRGFCSTLGHARLCTNDTLGCAGIHASNRALIGAGIANDRTLSTAGLHHAGFEHLKGAGLHS